MPDYLTASHTKDHFQAQLFRDHPEIVSIAPQLKLDDAGHPTEDGVIFVGISRRNPLRSGVGTTVSPVTPLPSSLPAVDDRGRFIAGEEIPVIVEFTGEVMDEMNTANPPRTVTHRLDFQSERQAPQRTRSINQ